MCCYQNFSSFVCFVFGMIVVIFAVCLSFSVWWSAHARGFLFLKLGVILTVGQPSHCPVCIPCTNLSFLSLQSAAFFSHLLTTLECTDLPFRLTSEWPLTKDMMFGVWSKFWNWILINLWYDLFVEMCENEYLCEMPIIWFLSFPKRPRFRPRQSIYAGHWIYTTSPRRSQCK